MSFISTPKQLLMSTITILATIGLSTVNVDAQQKIKFKPQTAIRKPFPAIVEPKSVSAKEAEKLVHAQELVVGVEIDGAARAYPINMLTGPQREIINDKLGDKAIAATW